MVSAFVLAAALFRANGAETKAPDAPPKKIQTFDVKHYVLSGNTILGESVVVPILSKKMGPAISFEDIRNMLIELQGAYRERGYVTVAVALPPQQITNGTVRIQVTEGRLAEIRVTQNRHFSSNNVMRDFPRLHTNALLNSFDFQPQLDRANANRDRQIYPIIAPGAEPGTTDLELKVKDRLPLHVRTEFNNNSTPNTPDRRLDTSIQYNNLWQLNHQLGAQYTFSPEAYKRGDFAPYDKPLIANYSAFYRMPVPGLDTGNAEIEYPTGNFGYDEATHRFRAPPLQRTTELLFFASRSSSDTGEALQSQSLSPAVLPPSGGLQVFDQVFARSVNPVEDIGFRFLRQLPEFAGIESSISAGLDVKNFRATSVQKKVFTATYYVPEIGTNGPPFIAHNPGQPIPPSVRTLSSHAEYMPISLGWNGSRKDKQGVTSFDFAVSYQPANILDSEADFQNAALDRKATGDFLTLNAGLTREQNIVAGYGIRIHADGQWANQPLLATEQFALGGLAGVRGYHEGQVYGDRGWRFTLEPHTPYINIGMVDNRLPVLMRAFTFFDAGQRFLIGNGLAGSPNTQEKTTTLMGAGVGLSFTAGQHFEGRFQVGFPFMDTPPQGPFGTSNVVGGQPRVAFGFAFVF
jgi:hemolysin activation/secretion protein